MTNSSITSVAQFSLAILLVAGLLEAELPAESSAPTETIPASVDGRSLTPAASASIFQGNPTETWVLPPKHHLWAHFPVGAWREIEVTTETFDETGKLFGQSVTTQREVLKAVADDTYVLDVQATVDVSGKRIAGPWNSRVLRLTTDHAGAVHSTNRHADELLSLGVGGVKCQIWELRYTEEGRNVLERIYYSPDVSPHVLRREISERSENSPVEMPPLDSVSTLALKVPFVFEGRIIECASQHSVRRREKGDTQTIALLSSDVPGGEVHSRSTDFDSSGRRIRWSVQKLVSFGISPSGHNAQQATVSSVSTPTEQK